MNSKYKTPEYLQALEAEKDGRVRNIIAGHLVHGDAPDIDVTEGDFRLRAWGVTPDSDGYLVAQTLGTRATRDIWYRTGYTYRIEYETPNSWDQPAGEAHRTFIREKILPMFAALRAER